MLNIQVFSGRRAAPLVGAGVFLLLLAAALWGVWRLASHELGRERILWRQQLALAADARVVGLERALAADRELIETLAANPSITLFLSEKTAGAVTAEAAQLDYIGNLLALSAAKAGFDTPPLGPELPANTPRQPQAGIALLDANGRILASSGGAMPPLQTILDRAGQGFAFMAPDGDPPLLIRYAMPVAGVQQDPGAAPIGFLYAARPAAAMLRPLVEQPDDGAAQGRSRLIAPFAGRDEYLDLLTGKKLPDSALTQWAATARHGFAIADDERGEKQLVVARPVAQPGWVLLRMIGYDRALAPLVRQRNLGLALLGLGLGLFAVLGVLVWRSVVAARLARSAQAVADAHRQSARLAEFLRLVSDGLPGAVLAFDAGDRLRFANRGAALLAGVESEAMTGKTLAAVFGAATAAPFIRLLDLAREQRQPVEAAVALDFGDHQRQGRASVLPLAGADAGADADMVLVFDDLSQLIAARDRREQGLEDLVSLLVGLIDARDPYAAEQSRRLSALATSVARERDFDEASLRTVRIAGLLANLGKVLVPEALLRRPATLTDPELREVRAAMARAAGLIAAVDFDAPVAQTLLALPHPGDAPAADAPATARLLDATNVFLSLISRRAHRPALVVEQALAMLRDEPERFDPAMVSALAHVLDNRGWRKIIVDWEQEPDDDA